jgi:hypothetical protein
VGAPRICTRGHGRAYASLSLPYIYIYTHTHTHAHTLTHTNTTCGNRERRAAVRASSRAVGQHGSPYAARQLQLLRQYLYFCTSASVFVLLYW